MPMSDSAPVAIPTDFYDDNGFVKSCAMSSHPAVGDTVVDNSIMYVVSKRSWDFDVGGIPLLVRIYIK
jgi:hypothetical protein